MGVQIQGDTGNVIATKGTYSGNVTIGGTLTYEDVTNIDSVGLITARQGIEVGASPGVAASISVDGNMIVSGITTIGGVVNASSDIKVGSGVTVGKDGDIFATGVTTSTTVKVGAAVTISESGIEASGIGITCANINGAKIGGRRNIIMNGDMTVAQRGTSSTTIGYQTLDRYYLDFTGTDEAPTQAQHTLSSSDDPYSEGFRYSYHITNGNQTGGAGSSDGIFLNYSIEAQDVAKSGWNYTSSSSFVTLSFWIKSSVAQNFYGRLYSYDGTSQGYAFETGSLTADQWKKVIVTIPGNSNLTFDNDTGAGLLIEWVAFRGTGFTASMTLNQWAAYNSNSRVPDMTSTWYTTNDATLEFTGIQLEVGPQATPFEHRCYGEELSLCRRYFYRIGDGTNTYQVVGNGFIGENGGTKCGKIVIHPLTTMRAKPTVSVIGTDSFRCTAGSVTMTCTATANTGGIWNSASTGDIMWMDFGRSGSGDPTVGYGCVVYADNNSANLALSADL